MESDNPQVIDHILNALTLEQQVGQLLLMNFPGVALPADASAAIIDCGIGGVLLFGHNIEYPAQTLALTESVQMPAPLVETAAGTYRIGLFVAVDQEGGTVSRLRPPATIMPGAMSIGATRSADKAYTAAAVTARELRAMGININCAPVLDVNNNPANPVIGVRSFSDWPQMVAELGVATIRGLQDNRVAACGKHFPGHGDTSVDSHLALPKVEHSWERLCQVELVPFVAAIAAGVQLIMTTHIVFPVLEQDSIPATLSPAVLTGLLRERMGFQNVIATDALNMQAIADRYSVADAVICAVKAGVDMLMPVTTVEQLRQAWEALLDAVRTGFIPRSQFEASVRRMLRLKQRLGLLVKPDYVVDPDRPALETVGSTEHSQSAYEIALAGTTLVRARPGILPLPRTGLAVLDFSVPRFNEAENPDKPLHLLERAIRQYATEAQIVTLDFGLDTPKPEQIQAAKVAVEQSLVLLVASRSANIVPAQAALIRSCLERAQERGIPVVQLMMRSPYEALTFPEIETVLAVYSDVPVSLEAGVAVLFGAAHPGGHMPVTLPVIL